jgi:hypothetical protein
MSLLLHWVTGLLSLAIGIPFCWAAIHLIELCFQNLLSMPMRFVVGLAICLGLLFIGGYALFIAYKCFFQAKNKAARLGPRWLGYLVTCVVVGLCCSLITDGWLSGDSEMIKGGISGIAGTSIIFMGMRKSRDL